MFVANNLRSSGNGFYQSPVCPCYHDNVVTSKVMTLSVIYNSSLKINTPFPLRANTNITIIIITFKKN